MKLRQKFRGLQKKYERWVSVAAPFWFSKLYMNAMESIENKNRKNHNEEEKKYE